MTTSARALPVALPFLIHPWAGRPAASQAMGNSALAPAFGLNRRRTRWHKSLAPYELAVCVPREPHKGVADRDWHFAPSSRKSGWLRSTVFQQSLVPRTGLALVGTDEEPPLAGAQQADVDRGRNREAAANKTHIITTPPHAPITNPLLTPDECTPGAIALTAAAASNQGISTCNASLPAR